ncbi:ABC1-like protein kinase [Cryptosporidium parvum]
MRKFKLIYEPNTLITTFSKNKFSRFNQILKLLKNSSQFIISEKKTGLFWISHKNKGDWHETDILIPKYSNYKDPKISIITKVKSIENHLASIETSKRVEKKVPTNSAVRLFHVSNMVIKLLLGSAKETYSDYKQGNGFSVKGKLLGNENIEAVNQTVKLLRGVALKFAQFINLNNIGIPIELSNALNDAKKNAFAIPICQVHKLMESEFGNGWKENIFAYFCENPFAAASIGQVHHGILKDGQSVAVKIQYPNIMKAILSDINLFQFVNSYCRIFPKGLFINELLAELKKELISECNYENELLFLKYYREKIIPTMNMYDLKVNFYIPTAFNHLSTKKILTTENMNSENTIEISSLFQDNVKSTFGLQNTMELRNSIAESLLYLTLHELFIFRTLQTDPNPANFLVDLRKNRIILLDFGAVRSYSEDFVDDYINMIRFAISGSEPDIIKQFIKMKFILGTESEDFIKLHCDAIKMVSEVFKYSPSPFDFSKSEIVANISKIVPNILLNRETPPLSDIYSLHRRIAGFFIICSRLGAAINSHKIFNQVLEKYNTRRVKSTPN